MKNLNSLRMAALVAVPSGSAIQEAKQHEADGL